MSIQKAHTLFLLPTRSGAQDTAGLLLALRLIGGYRP
jgi:hypothetical protein